MRELTFQSYGTYWDNGRKVVRIKLPRACGDFDWLIGQQVVIDRRDYRVLEVRHLVANHSYRRGDMVELVIESVEQEIREYTGWMIKGVDFL